MFSLAFATAITVSYNIPSLFARYNLDKIIKNEHSLTQIYLIDISSQSCQKSAKYNVKCLSLLRQSLPNPNSDHPRSPKRYEHSKEEFYQDCGVITTALLLPGLSLHCGQTEDTW